MGELSQWTYINNTTIDSNVFSTPLAVKHLQYNISSAIVTHLSSVSNSLNATLVHNVTDKYNSFKNTWNCGYISLAILYFIVVVGGVFGNGSLIITLYTQSSARLRNPLLVAVCVADMLVSGIAAPISIFTLAMLLHHKNAWSIPSTFTCKSTHFLQVSFDCIIHEKKTSCQSVE